MARMGNSLIDAFSLAFSAGWLVSGAESHYIEAFHLLRSGWRYFGFVIDCWFKDGGGAWAEENFVFLQIRRVWASDDGGEESAPKQAASHSRSIGELGSRAGNVFGEFSQAAESLRFYDALLAK
jgi:hypothetical protein